MATIVIDTNIIALAAYRKTENTAVGREALRFLNLVEWKLIKVRVDSEGIIEKEYHKYIKEDWDTRTWWKTMQQYRLVDRYTLSSQQRGPYPDTNLSKEDKTFMDVAAQTDTKMLVSEDSDFYENETKINPHPVVIERGIRLMRLKKAMKEIDWTFPTYERASQG